MRFRDLSIFQRLLWTISATALLVALISGGAHYLFSIRLIEASARTQMSSALATSNAFLQRAYAVPVSRHLRLLQSSPALDPARLAGGAGRVADVDSAQREMLSILRSSPGLYRALTLLGADGSPRAVVVGGKPLRAARLVPDDATSALFARVVAAAPAGVVYHGPIRHADGRFSVLAGAARRDAGSGRLAGVIVAEVALDGFVAHLADIEILDHPVAWLFDARGDVLLSPPAGRSRLDPRSWLHGEPPPDGALLVASTAVDDPGGVGDLLHVVLSLPGDALATSLSHAALIALGVLVLVVALSSVITLAVARQIASPLRALSRLAQAVGQGDLSRRIEDVRGGEEGRLARAFNRMLDALNATMVSREYVNEIIESMSDAVIVFARDGTIETVNRAAGDLLGWDAENLPGSPVAALLPDAGLRAQVADALERECALEDVQTRFKRSDGRLIPVWFSCSPMHGRTGAFCGLVGVARDVSERLRAQRELEQAHQALSFHVENSPLAVIEWDNRFRVQRWSRRAESIFGWKSEEVLGRTPQEFGFVFEEDAAQVDEFWRRLQQGEPRNVCRNRNHRADGSVVHCEWHNSLLVDEVGNPVSVLSLVQDVTESHMLSEKLSYQATHDPLTGLVNRRAFENRLAAALATAREDGVEHALCFVDLDQFKIVNDSCGHAAGDELLRRVGELLRGGVRKQDTVARLGGDEFALLMEHCGVDAASRVAESILLAMRENPFLWDGKSFRVGASIGLVPVSGGVRDAGEVLSAADTACLAAKGEGRDRVHVCDDDEDFRRHRGEVEWVSRLNLALEDDRFFLMAQPIVGVGVGADALAGYELLLRMSDEEGRVVPPSSFLPAAERYHMMPKVDRWVIRNAIALLEQARAPFARPPRVFINLSGQSLADATLLDFVADIIERSGVAPGALCFEITETAAIANFTRANAFIQALSALGCRFALDDFGTGVSSFAYLKNLPVDYLKIDGMFVRDLVDDATNLALVRSINEVGHAMGKCTVAEFVEDQAILDRLREIGVDFAQGYHVGRPVLARQAFGTDACPVLARSVG